MLSPEQFCYEKLLGVRKEHTTNLVAVALLVGLSKVYARATGLEMVGSTPAEGERFYFFNHLDDRDIFRLTWASLQATRGENGEKALGRIPRALAKSTFFGIPESSKIRERTGKKDMLNSSNPLVDTLVRLAAGSLLYGNGCIPIRRGTADRLAEAEVNTALGLHQPVASALNETRDETGGLKGLRPGPAYFLRTHRNVPYQLVGVSKDPHRVHVGRVQTYAELELAAGDLSLRELTMVLADGVIELLPERIQQRWQLGERQAGYQSLYSRRAQAARTL